MRNAAHALGSTRHDEARFAGADVLGREDDRLESRAARLIHGEGDPLLRDAGLHHDLARHVGTAARLPRAAVDQLVDVLGGDAGALQRRSRRGDAQLGRGHVGKGAEEATDGGP